MFSFKEEESLKILFGKKFLNIKNDTVANSSANKDLKK